MKLCNLNMLLRSVGYPMFLLLCVSCDNVGVGNNDSLWLRDTNRMCIGGEHNNDDIDAAIPKLDQLVSEGGSYARLVRSECYRAMGMLRESNQDLTFLINHKIPGLSRLYLARGRNNELLGNLEAAIADYTNSINEDKYSSDIFTLRGDVYRKQGKNTLSISDYKASLKLYKNRRLCANDDCSGYSHSETKIYLKLLHMYEELGMASEFKNTLVEALNRNPGSDELKREFGVSVKTNRVNQ